MVFAVVIVACLTHKKPPHFYLKKAVWENIKGFISPFLKIECVQPFVPDCKIIINM